MQAVIAYLVMYFVVYLFEKAKELTWLVILWLLQTYHRQIINKTVDYHNYHMIGDMVTFLYKSIVITSLVWKGHC